VVREGKGKGKGKRWGLEWIERERRKDCSSDCGARNAD